MSRRCSPKFSIGLYKLFQWFETSEAIQWITFYSLHFSFNLHLIKKCNRRWLSVELQFLQINTSFKNQKLKIISENRAADVIEKNINSKQKIIFYYKFNQFLKFKLCWAWENCLQKNFESFVRVFKSPGTFVRNELWVSCKLIYEWHFSISFSLRRPLLIIYEN